MAAALNGACVLAVDTSSDKTSVGVALDDGSVHTLSVACSSHEQALPKVVKQLMSDYNLAISAISLVLYGTGPGSFTGLRVGSAAAFGLGAGRGVPVVGVSSHYCLALAYSQEHLVEPDQCLVILGDAHKDSVFVSIFKATATHFWQVLVLDQVLELDDLQALLIELGINDQVKAVLVADSIRGVEAALEVDVARGLLFLRHSYHTLNEQLQGHGLRYCREVRARSLAQRRGW